MFKNCDEKDVVIIMEKIDDPNKPATKIKVDLSQPTIGNRIKKLQQNEGLLEKISCVNLKKNNCFLFNLKISTSNTQKTINESKSFIQLESNSFRVIGSKYNLEINFFSKNIKEAERISNNIKKIKSVRKTILTILDPTNKLIPIRLNWNDDYKIKKIKTKKEKVYILKMEKLSKLGNFITKTNIKQKIQPPYLEKIDLEKVTELANKIKDIKKRSQVLLLSPNGRLILTKFLQNVDDLQIFIRIPWTNENLNEKEYNEVLLNEQTNKSIIIDLLKSKSKYKLFTSTKKKLNEFYNVFVKFRDDYI